jgi:ABC-2 type transport system permease protein
VVNWIGGVLGFSESLLKTTPFGLLPRLPAEPMAWTPVIVESVVAGLLIAAGFWGYQRRDVG